MRNLKAVVTGGAGFIGSYLTEELLDRSCAVALVDNFSTGRIENLSGSVGNPLLSVVREDLREPSRLAGIVAEHDVIFHLAANPEVRVGQTSPKVHFEENVVTTFNLLEAVRQASRGKVLVFASTSTVYGEALKVPTPEDYGPLAPVSTYGASKLASESLLTSYAYTFGHRVLILRLANIVGSRSSHGVIADFVRKVRVNSEELEVLGDGKQEKSYMYIADLIGAIVHLTELFLEGHDRVGIYNVGSRDRVSVKEIAEIVARVMGCPGIRFKFTGGVDGGRGWMGDVKVMQLSIEKLVGTGWTPKYSSKEAVRLAVEGLCVGNSES